MLTCQVLILTPFIVLNMLTSLTVTLDTHAFVLYLPRPPMLIPWPGPQFTLCMFMSLHPVWMETQSSPALHKAQNFMLIASFTFRRNQLITQVLLVFFELAPLVLNLAILEILRLSKVTG